ncbi:MAG: type secretion system protein [Desulfomicrobiaceae bacterium]|jgi:type IV pilus assembly protein PilC|nr:type II secretion system F family protein [Desulfomicrobiaceae bacterium]MBZ4685424.1 type secretion system protein [Desulfomicrobiaceae bacterium]MDK2873735.1 type pilus assembly protein PilC [Desulfomicrobiaceae bacterium]HCF05300.1 pilus assembly protein PilC [Desulfomicrobiaceae bacterium]
MAIFLYRVKTRGGRTLKGEMDAPSADVVEAALRRKGYQEIKVKPKPKDLLEGTFLEGGVSDRDMVVFSRQFATMINAGVPILQSLQILSEQTENPKLRRRLYSIRADIEGGSSLFDALKKYPDIFDSLYTNMVNAGEAGGILDQVLLRLADYIEKAAKLKAKIKGAMIYPAVVVTVAIAVIAVILIFVIPTFKTMFESMGGSLPAPTVFVINLSNFVVNNFLLLLGGAVAAFVAFKLFYRWEKGQILVDRWVLFLPVFGPLLRKAAVAKFSRTLSTMVSSGVPILNALDIVSKTSGNKTVELGVLDARKSIAEGQTLAEPLEETGVFPPMVIHMISIGEATGALDTMLGKIADFYDDEVDVAVESLTSLIEPVMIVFLGVVVGGLVISMYLPIFSIADVVSK